ncbi:DNA-binding response regulator [Chitinophaga horti]|uniref:DNA-binding response regulator n=1 Tax=Chitinophaga horti TaxID=2920382 RepID=A0ABY6IXY9_9BACT|nr:DNA-binding response regulator [Chitinophaga horti]UYQ92128.1 DNA-binding response regulator [Chitinophaga horti]
MTRVLIIEDEFIIARFIEKQIKNHFSCETAIAITAAETISEMERFMPDLLLCDINLGDGHSGIDLVHQLQQAYRFEVIYITSYNAKDIIEQAISSGAANYIIKPVDEMQLFAGVRMAIGKIENKKANDSTAATLTPAEQRIVSLIGMRKSTKEIAEVMHLSPYTIKNQRHKICVKLGLKDENNALLKWALKQLELK